MDDTTMGGPALGGGYDDVGGNIVADHVYRLEQLATALIATGNRDEEDEARLYGQRLKAGVRALTSVRQLAAPLCWVFVPPEVLLLWLLESSAL